MVQRRAVRFVIDRYRNASNVTDMLDYLGWETHESRRTKLQLTVFYIIVHFIAIPHSRYLALARMIRAAHSYKLQQYPIYTDCFKFSFSPEPSPHGTDCKQLLLSLSLWYHSRGSWVPFLLFGYFLHSHECKTKGECWAVPLGLVPK